MILTHEVEVAILQHHERFDGKGFPDAKPGFKISEEAQILSIADQLYDLTVARLGQQAVSLEEAFAVIAANGSINPEIAAKVRKILGPKEATKAKVGA